MAVHDELVPRHARVADGFFADCRARMSLWFVVPAPAQGEVQVEPGEASARATFASYDALVKGGKGIPYTSLRKLLSFGWLLTEADRRTLTKWADSAAAAGEEPKGGAAGGSRKAAAARGPTAASQVAGLFAKRKS